MSDQVITVEVAYATPQRQWVIPVRLALGATAWDAMVLSGVVRLAPGLDLGTAAVGICGKLERNPQTTVLTAGDRVEIYRPLVADPKLSRKRRAARASNSE